jgi:glycerol uptake facilitator-like aquaporin
MKQAPITYIRWFLAEFLGTGFLAATAAVLITSAYLGIPGYEYIFIPMLLGIAIFVLIISLGWVSGAHFNPAITISQALFRKVSLDQAALYVVSQLAGAFVGVRVANLLLATTSLSSETSSTAILAGEFIGALVLSLVVMLAVTKRISEQAAPAVISASLVLGLMLSAHTGGGILNPAVAFGLSSFTFTFLLMPVVGAICGAAFAVLFDETDKASSL